MADEFAMLDNALEGIEAPSAQRDLLEAFDELQARPVPPPPSGGTMRHAHDEGDLNSLLDSVLEQQSKAPLRPRPDLSLHVDKSVRQQYAGQQFATYRSINNDEAEAEYDNRPPSQRGTGATPRAAAAASVVPPPEPIRAPWGEETLRMPAQGRTVVSSGVSKAAVAPASAAAYPTLAEEFDLLNPPDEEKQQLKIPALDPRLAAVTLNVATLDGQKMSLQVNDTWTVEEVTAMVAQRLVIWQSSFFALSVSEIGGTLADRWLNPRLTVRDEQLGSASQLVFKIKYFKYPKKLRDPNAVYYFYVQVRTMVISGTLDTSVPMGFQLAALQFAIHHQPYRPQSLRVGMLWERQAETGGPSLPSAHLDAVQQNGFDKRYIERRIFTAYEHVKDANRQDAIYAYLKTVKDLPLYGSSIFNVTLNGEPRVVGIAEDGMLLSTSAQTKLQNFTTVRGVAVAPPKYEFTPYEDISKIELGKGSVAVTILSDSDSAHHVFQLSHQNAVSLVELMCGYRRMLEAYVRLSPSFVYPVRAVHPHPALYGKPVPRKKLVYSTSRAAVFKQRYLATCRERKIEPHMPLVRELDFATDTDTPIEVLSLSGLRWGRSQLMVVLDALVAAKTHQFVDNEDFMENMKLRWLDLSGNSVLEKGFFTDLLPYFQTLAKHPYELQGLALRNCRLDDDAMTALKCGSFAMDFVVVFLTLARQGDAHTPIIAHLKTVEMWDFSKNIFRDDGLHQLILGARDANASFTSLTVQNCNLRDHKIMKLVSAMLDKNSNIVKLDMSDCNIRDIGIAFLLKGLANHRSLRNVNLSGNQFGASQASIDLFLWARASNVLEEFRMARLQMPAKTVKAVVALVEKPHSTLRCLDVSGNSFGSKAGLILEALSNNVVLQELHVGDFDVTEKTSSALHRFLKGTAKCLVHLDLRGTPIGKKMLPGILQAVALDKLRVLDLTGVTGVQGSTNGVALANLVERSSALETLILCGIAFDREAWKAFLQGIPGAKSLTRLELDGINVEKVPLGALKDALSKCPAVRELSLRRCPGLSHEQLIDFLAVVAVGSDSGLRLIDVRANRDLINLLKHKKFGEKYASVLDTVYLELRCDTQEKTK